MAKKKLEKSKKSNKDEELVPVSLVTDVVESVAAKKSLNQRDRFLLYWVLGYNAGIAAKLCGLKPKTGYNYATELRKNQSKLAERLQEITSLMPEKYRAVCRMRLADVAEIEGAALQELKENPRLALERPQILRQVKQAAGALADDSVHAPSINVSLLTVLQSHVAAKIDSRLGPDRIQGEVVDAEVDNDEQN